MSTDQWLEQYSRDRHEWDKTALVFGFGDDYAGCEAMTGVLVQKFPDAQYRCVPANSLSLYKRRVTADLVGLDHVTGAVFSVSIPPFTKVTNVRSPRSSTVITLSRLIKIFCCCCSLPNFVQRATLPLHPPFAPSH